MTRRPSWESAAVLIGTILITWTTTAGQSASASPSATQVTAGQQRQLDHLNQLQEQMQKDRDAVHAAITQYGWDSDQTDAAMDQLSRDRTEYRQLRRSLRVAGVAVPPPAGMGQRAFRNGPGRNCPRCGAGAMRSCGRGYRGRMCGCRCCGY